MCLFSWRNFFFKTGQGWFLIGLILLFSSCECTAVACSYTLGIKLVGNVPEGYIFEAITPDGRKREGSCMVDEEGELLTTVPDSCNFEEITFSDFAPDEVTLTISWDNGSASASQTYKPTYETFYPSAPCLSPACRQAQVDFVFPEGS